MSDERPATPEPGEAPPTPTAGETPAAAEPAAAGPPPDEAPTVEARTVEDTSAAPDEAPTVEAPAVDPAAAETAPPAVEATPSPAPVAPATDRAPGRGVFVPAWVAVVVGVLLVAGLGFAIGWIASPGDDSDTSNAVATQPGSGTTETPGNDSGNRRPVPSDPGNGNRDSDDDDDDNGATPVPPLFQGAYFGVTVESVDDDGGARITAVAPDSPAAEAGLQAGDVVTAIDGDEVESSLDLIRSIRQHEPDDSITVTYTRNGNSTDAEITLSERPRTQSVS